MRARQVDYSFLLLSHFPVLSESLQPFYGANTYSPGRFRCLLKLAQECLSWYPYGTRDVAYNEFPETGHGAQFGISTLDSGPGIRLQSLFSRILLPDSSPWNQIFFRTISNTKVKYTTYLSLPLLPSLSLLPWGGSV